MKALPLCLALAATPAVSDNSTAYHTDFLGNYAPQSQCIGQEFILSLMEDRVSIGETGCTIARIDGKPGGPQTLSLTQCNAEGEPAPDRQIVIDLSGNTLSLQADGNLTLTRCTDI